MKKICRGVQRLYICRFALKHLLRESNPFGKSFGYSSILHFSDQVFYQKIIKPSENDVFTFSLMLTWKGN